MISTPPDPLTSQSNAPQLLCIWLNRTPGPGIFYLAFLPEKERITALRHSPAAACQRNFYTPSLCLYFTGSIHFSDHLKKSP